MQSSEDQEKCTQILEKGQKSYMSRPAIQRLLVFEKNQMPISEWLGFLKLEWRHIAQVL